MATLDLVNMRMGDADGPQAGSIAEAFSTPAQLQQEGLVRHLGVSNATTESVTHLSENIAGAATIRSERDVVELGTIGR